MLAMHEINVMGNIGQGHYMQVERQYICIKRVDYDYSL